MTEGNMNGDKKTTVTLTCQSWHHEMKVKICLDWLKEDTEELAHWFKQLGLHHKIVFGDLQRLSQEPTSDSSKTKPNFC